MPCGCRTYAHSSSSEPSCVISSRSVRAGTSWRCRGGRRRGGGGCRARGGLGRGGGRDRPVGGPQAGGVAEPRARVGAPRDDRTACRAGRADHLDALRVEDVAPAQSRRCPLGVDQRRQVRLGRVRTAGLVAAGSQVLAQCIGCAFQEVGADEGPAFRCAVDEVGSQCLGVPGEPVLMRGEEQRQVVAGVAVPVGVRAGVSGAGGAGDDRTSGQRIFLSWAGQREERRVRAPGAAGAAAGAGAGCADADRCGRR